MLKNVNELNVNLETLLLIYYSCILYYAEFLDLSIEVLYKELKTVTDPILLGVVLGVPQHCLEIIQRNNPQGVFVCTPVHTHTHTHTHKHSCRYTKAAVKSVLISCQ